MSHIGGDHYFLSLVTYYFEVTVVLRANACGEKLSTYYF